MGIGNFKDMRGLIPGSMTNLNALNPFKIMGSFFTGSNPECQEITMEVIDDKNNKSTESKYVATVDIQDLDPCIFDNKKILFLVKDALKVIIIILRIMIIDLKYLMIHWLIFILHPLEYY